MAPTIDAVVENVVRAIDNDHGSSLATRDLQNPNHTQRVTLGVIAAYVVGIAILWNVPYLRMVLWPFKVSGELYQPDQHIMLTSPLDAGHRLP